MPSQLKQMQSSGSGPTTARKKGMNKYDIAKMAVSFELKLS
jgi:hypothetical protein